MPRRNAAFSWTSVALAAALVPLGAKADAPHVNAALLFLQASCGLPNARLETRRSDGRLMMTLRTPQFTRQTNLVHNDLRQFTEDSMRKNAEMPPELGACFEPASNQVINVLMELPANVASLPMAAPPAPAGTAPNGGYVPPMVTTPAPTPAPATVQATPAPTVPAPAAATAPASSNLEPIYTFKGCRVFEDNDNHVSCDVQVSNQTGRDLWIAVNKARTKFFDANGNEQRMDGIRMSAQNVEWRESVGRVRVIHDTSPTLNVYFNWVPKSVAFVKRLDLTIGYDSPDGTKMQLVAGSNMPIKGR